MRFSWVMQDLLLRLGGNGGVKQTKPAEAWPLARPASSSIPTPVQVFNLVSGAFLISPRRQGAKPPPPRGAHQTNGATPGPIPHPPPSTTAPPHTPGHT